MDAAYIKKRDALLARIAQAEQVYEEQTALAEKMKAKADALVKVREQQDYTILMTEKPSKDSFPMAESTCTI